MIFDNPDALWLLLALPPLLLGLALWGWKAKKEAMAAFPLDLRHLRKKQVEKYAMAAVIAALLIMTLSLPKVTYYASATAEKTGEIILLVDVSASMAAQVDIDSPTRLERTKELLYEIIDSMEELSQVKISLHGFTSIARSQVPFVGTEDYPYLIETIDKVLDINSVPGEGTSLGASIQNVTGKFSEGEQNRIVVLFGDGEPFYGQMRGMTYREKLFINEAVEEVLEEGIKLIAVGVGEQAGARIPVYDSNGEFTGDYAQSQGFDYFTYLDEETLKDIASRTEGEYFFEEDVEALIECIKENLGSLADGGSNKQVRMYQSIAHWFLLAALPVWVVFARRHILER